MFALLSAACVLLQAVISVHTELVAVPVAVIVQLKRLCRLRIRMRSGYVVDP